MPTMLDTLFETRDSAEQAYQGYITPLLAENRELTEDEEKRVAELKGDLERVESRILDVEKDVERDRLVQEARQRLGTAQAEASIKVKEARTYGPGSKNSYFADLCRSSHAGMPGHESARERLAQHAREVAGEMRDPNSTEGQRAARVIRNRSRGERGEQVELEVERAAHFAEQGLETRAGMNTSSTSGGSFVTPQYFVSEYAPYRMFDRVFADAANKMPLPDYGMTIYLPAVNTAAGVAAQVGENQGITETDPDAGYLSVGLTTNAGQVTVSQQLLDRAGPDFNFDVMVFDQLRRAYNSTLDAYCISQALANAGTIAFTSGSLVATSGGYFGLVGQAKAAMIDAAGSVLPATHVFLQPINFEYFASRVDTTNRTLWTPNYAGPFNAVGAGGNGDPVAEGDTGYRISGVRVFTDGNIPTSSSYNQSIVAHMPEVWFWEGDLVTRTVPQTVAQNLSVLLQCYAYVAEIVRYQKAVQVLQGAGLPTNPSF